jgi:protein-arginine deiminase
MRSLFLMRRWLTLPLAAFALSAGCGGADTPVGAGGGGTTPSVSSSSAAGTSVSTGPALAEAVIAIGVDADRDGKADPAGAADRAHRNDFDAMFGASFLANLDDDDKNGIRDADDDVLNGDADLEDLARITLAPWPDAPDGAAGKLGLDAVAAGAVRLFKKGADGAWTAVAGSLGACVDGPNKPCAQQITEVTLSTAEVRAGVELGLEARRFRLSKTDAWTGDVDISYKILEKDAADGKPFTSADAPEGVDRAKLRVAPWVLFGNLSPFDTVWASAISAPFVSGIDAATKKGAVTFNKIKNWSDQWTQDLFQTAWTAIPGAGGAPKGLRIANARPWGRNDNQDSSLPITWLKKGYLGPDRGILEIYRKKWTGTSFDSHGNHDLIPAYENPAKGTKYPLGRIVIGSSVLPEMGLFYDAQEVQGPHLELVTDWLYVGHVDEFLSYVPAKTPRGWKLLVASARLAKSMLEKAKADGNGAAHMFVGKQRYVGETNVMVSAEVSIDDTLANVDLLQASQEAQAAIDENLVTLKAELGLADDEIIEIPTLFEDLSGFKVAWAPGTVNLLAFNGHVAHPDPWGPQINGVDLWKQDLMDRLGTPQSGLGVDGQGLDVNFVDDWDDYHILDGEVHCGSNPEASAPFSSVTWWEAKR